MNVVRFELDNDYGWNIPAVRILIDEVDLIDLARAVEQPFADAEDCPELAGGYAWLAIQDFVTPSRRLWGDSFCEAESKVALLGCGGCGEEWCWPLTVRISTSTDTVAWSDFEQPHRPEWDLSKLGPFVFDRRQYKDAITALNDVQNHI